jgi:hypothetical protein
MITKELQSETQEPEESDYEFSALFIIGEIKEEDDPSL